VTRLTDVTTVPAGSRQFAGVGARSWSNVLAEVPLFAGLSKRHLNKVAATGTVKHFHPGTVLVRAGEPGDALFVVIDGQVSVRRPGLPEITLRSGSFFGETSLLDDGGRTATVVADGQVTCVTITRSRFLKLLKSEPAITIEILKEVVGRLRAVQAIA
jgi:CRP/FNR family transcriptional regulator, cyclic AMP receptor protein